MGRLAGEVHLVRDDAERHAIGELRITSSTSPVISGSGAEVARRTKVRRADIAGATHDNATLLLAA
jgi:hypothetical protein